MFFFDVFFIQKNEYGINYSEINKVLMSKRLYEREYQEYQKILDENYLKFTLRTSLELENITL